MTPNDPRLPEKVIADHKQPGEPDLILVSLKLAEEPGLGGMKPIATNFQGFATDLARHLEARATTRA